MNVVSRKGDAFFPSSRWQDPDVAATDDAAAGDINEKPAIPGGVGVELPRSSSSRSVSLPEPLDAFSNR